MKQFTNEHQPHVTSFVKLTSHTTKERDNEGDQIPCAAIRWRIARSSIVCLSLRTCSINSATSPDRDHAYPPGRRTIQKYPSPKRYSRRSTYPLHAIHLRLARSRMRVLPRPRFDGKGRQKAQSRGPQNDHHDARHQQG